jgi:adenylate cyclase
VLRIGINLGDVIGEGSDIYGEGVNIAARLEVLSEPGCICVSGKVMEEVRGKTGMSFDDMGEQVLKNITAPVRTFRARIGEPAPLSSPAPVAPSKASIVVLPFSNMSGDPTQDYFADGITEDIITELARYSSLAVVARNSSFQFRGPGVDLAAVRRILGVRYIVEGSIQKSGARIRVTAQLIDAATGNHLWAERYDRTIEDVFAVQDEVVQTIVSTLEGRLAASAAAQIRGKPTTSWVAYDYFLQGRELSTRYKIREADEFLARSIDLDPFYAQAHAWRASTLVAKYWYDGQQQTLEKAKLCAETALSLDNSDAWCHQAMGFVSLHSNKFDLAGMHFERAMSLNPNDVYVMADYANWLCHMGRLDEALRYLDLAIGRDPFPPSWIWEIRGTVLLFSKRYEEAITAFQKAPIENFFTHALLASAYAWAGQNENARHEVALARAGKPDLAVSFFATAPYADEAHRKHIMDGLRIAGLT